IRTGENNTIIASIGTLSVSGSAVVTIVVQPTSAGSVVNSATVTGDLTGPHGNSASASQTTQVNAPSAMVTSPAASPAPSPTSSPKPSPTTTPTPGVDGPQISSVERFGFHAEPTTLLLRFNEALDPVRAQNVSDYRIIGPGGSTVAIASATYD